MYILGAGMAGCLAGVLNPSATILEASSELPDNHNAVLRFREDTISKITGIPFKKVKVYKSIYSKEHGHVTLNPKWINLYSQKVIGNISSRSITNLDTVERYVAPSDFHKQLADLCGDRIHYDKAIELITIDAIHYGDNKFIDSIKTNNDVIISTMPMSILSGCLVDDEIDEEFEFQTIRTTRFKIPDCNVYQTIYYPEEGLNIYRATLTGEDLIVESMNEKPTHNELVDVAQSFGISPYWLTGDLEATYSEQRYGKIAPINEEARRKFILDTTTKYNIYSLGRFACWRNILLDDVYYDIMKIKELSRIGNYHRHLS